MERNELIKSLESMLTEKIPYGDLVGAEGLYAHSGLLVYEDPKSYFIEQAIGDVKELSQIKDILGDDYDLSHLRELVQAYREGRCIYAPAQIGDIVYHITTCKDFAQVLDGTMYDQNGECGTATGYYCPCELAENCPFLLEEDESFDCDKHKNILAIYEDVVTGIVINDMESYVRLDYSGCVDFDDFGKTVFLTREAAEEALKGEKHV